MKKLIALLVITLAVVSGVPLLAADSVTLLNVSYHPTRELYQEYSAAFSTHWQKKTGQAVTVKQSHSGSGLVIETGTPVDLALFHINELLGEKEVIDYCI